MSTHQFAAPTPMPVARFSVSVLATRLALLAICIGEWGVMLDAVFTAPR